MSRRKCSVQKDPTQTTAHKPAPRMPASHSVRQGKGCESRRTLACGCTVTRDPIHCLRHVSVLDHITLERTDPGSQVQQALARFRSLVGSEDRVSEASQPLRRQEAESRLSCCRGRGESLS